MPRLRVKKLWFMAAVMVPRMPVSCILLRSGTREKRMPSDAPGKNRLFTASTTMMTIRATIIHLVMRSTPFCKPKEQITKPSTTMMSIQMVMVTGWPSIPEKALSMPALSSPLISPMRNR